MRHIADRATVAGGGFRRSLQTGNGGKQVGNLGRLKCLTDYLPLKRGKKPSGASVGENPALIMYCALHIVKGHGRRTSDNVSLEFR